MSCCRRAYVSGNTGTPYEQSLHVFKECILGSLPDAENLEDIVKHLREYFLPWGKHLLMGSKYYMVDQLSEIRSVNGKLLLFGSKDAEQPDADGFYATPRGVAVVHDYDDPCYNAIILDNRIPYDDRFPHRGEEVRFDYIDGKETAVVDLHRKPLMIFPRDSVYTHPRARQRMLNAWRAPCEPPPGTKPQSNINNVD